MADTMEIILLTTQLSPMGDAYRSLAWSSLNMLTLGLVPTWVENASEIPSHFVDTEVEA